MLDLSLLRSQFIAYWFIVAGAVLLCVVRANGQQAPGQVSTQLTTVRGMVRVGVSGDPLSHALVRIGGDASAGALTDGDGRFEIPEIPAGPQEFTVSKPGFLDEAEAGADSNAWNAHGYSHNVIVAAQMGDVVFTMEPANSIRGQIQLSTGDSAEGMQVMLLRRTIQDGRAIWQLATTAKTNSEGIYRFGGLTDGLYAVYTMPAMESDGDGLAHGGALGRAARAGYASVFFPDARDLGSSAKIPLRGGEQSQANIVLRLEQFQPVAAKVTLPRASGQSDNIAVQVMDSQGNQLPYSAQYDGSTHRTQAMLPEGSYTFQAATASSVFHIAAARDGARVNLASIGNGQGLAGEVSFTVAGRAVLNLQLPMAITAPAPIQVSLLGGTQQNGRETSVPQVFVTLSGSGGWIGDGMVTSFAEGPASSSLRPIGVPAGRYWAHTSIGPRTMCEGSFTAGGASLAREPLTLTSAGNTAPLTLTLRNDCAQLTLSLPGSVAYTAGEERAFTVYLVPDFDSTQDVIPQTLRTSTGGRITLTGLTPGSYHVFAFERPVALEYRNREVLASLPSQAVSLAPNENAELTLEIPRK